MASVLGLIPFKSKLVSIGLIVALIQVFLLINASFIYGQYAPQVVQVLSVYFFLFLIIALPIGFKLPIFKERPKVIQNFIIAFIITAALMTILPTIIVKTASLEFITLSLGFGLLHGFVKAYIEEVVFRYALPIAFGLGDIFSSLLFALFHISVILLSPSMVFGLDLILRFTLLFALGLIWSLTRNKLGLMGSIGSNFAYNLAVLGALPILGVI